MQRRARERGEICAGLQAGELAASEMHGEAPVRVLHVLARALWYV